MMSQIQKLDLIVHIMRLKYSKKIKNIENISFDTKEMIAKRLVEKISNELKANG